MRKYYQSGVERLAHQFGQVIIKNCVIENRKDTPREHCSTSADCVAIRGATHLGSGQDYQPGGSQSVREHEANEDPWHGRAYPLWMSRFVFSHDTSLLFAGGSTKRSRSLAT